MYKRKEKIFIISELSPQNEGDIDALKTMILQSKMGGADAVKIQVYDSVKMLGDARKKFCEVNQRELKELTAYSNNIGIDLFASAFDSERFDWLKSLNLRYHKIASRTHSDNKHLAEAIAMSGKITFVSNGKDQNDFSLDVYKNVKYLYCVSEYPALLENIKMPNFKTHPHYVGYSDHTYGLTAIKASVVMGAKYIEKHFTLSKGMQSSVNKAHLGSMNFQELIELRSFCDDFVRMGMS